MFQTVIRVDQYADYPWNLMQMGELYLRFISEIPVEKLRRLNDAFYHLNALPLKDFPSSLVQYFDNALIDPNNAMAHHGPQDNSFSAQYEDKTSNVKGFVNFVKNNIISQFSETLPSAEKYYALFFAIVQSSGYGKSRMIFEAAKHGLNTIYSNVSTTSAGYPKCTTGLLDFLTNINSVPHLQLFLCITYKIAHGHITKNDRAAKFLPLNSFQGTDFTFSFFWSKVINEFLCITDSKAVTQNNITEFQAYKFFRGQQQSFGDYSLSKKRVDNKENGYIKLSDRTLLLPELLLVFDEARSLLKDDEKSVFRNLRRALKGLGSRNMVLVFMDTLTSVTNFSPAPVFDSSARYTETAKMLLPPFYEILTYDALFDYCPLNLANEDEYFEFFKQGRPLWGALLKEPLFRELLPDMRLESLIDFAQQKLLCMPKAQILANKPSITGLLAVMAIRFGVEGILDHSTGARMMSSHMGTGTLFSLNKCKVNCIVILGIYLDDDRIRMVVMYPPEPVLAEAACRSLHYSQHTSLEDKISLFLTQIICGVVSAGEIGEMICRMILALTYDSVMLSRFEMAGSGIYSAPTTVAEFLEELIAPSYTEDFKAIFSTTDNKPAELCKTGVFSGEYLSGEISFTSWTFLRAFNPKEAFVNDTFLESLYKKRVAVVFQVNQAGTDFMIPVKLADGTFTFILVQVKNRDTLTNAERFEAAGPKLTPKSCFDIDLPNEYLALYVEIGPEHYKETFRDFGNDLMRKFQAEHPRHLILFGFDSMSVSSQDPLKTIFKLFCRREVDRVNEAERSVVLRKMVPFTFDHVKRSCRCQSGCSSSRCGCIKRKEKCISLCYCEVLKNCKNNKN